LGFSIASRRIWLLVIVVVALAPATPAHAAFPGTNGKIVFESRPPGNGDIFTVNPDGSGLSQLTNDPDSETQPAWSPDGRYIAYVRTSSQTGQSTLYRMNADGSGASAVFQGYGIGEPAWSPDAQKIAFVFDADVWTVGADGVDRRQVTNTSNVFELDPAWSPDGSKIAYSRDDLGTTHDNIHLIGPDGSGDTTLTSGLADEMSPNWSPDGQQVAFREANSDLYGLPPHNDGIYTIAADGSGLAKLSLLTRDDRHPAWSPDGSKIVVDTFASSTFTSDIETMNPRGGVHATVFRSGGLDEDPDWQPSTPTGFPRPRGATPLAVKLVIAYASCSAPDRAHGAPLAFGSCSPPQQSSPYLTAGTPDANGAAPNFAGSVRLDVKPGNPGTPEDDADVRLLATLSDVRCRVAIARCTAGALSDYTGQLKGTLVLRVTDQYSGVLLDQSATGDDREGTEYPDQFANVLPFTIGCAATAASAIGSTCSLDTTLDALIPGVVPEGKRSNWEIGRVEIQDAGADGIADPERDPTTTFATQGLFVP
jgi:TolB protein